MAVEDEVVDDQDGGEDDQSDTSNAKKDAANVNNRLTKLESMLAENARVLEEERRASAGKDKKITELQTDKKKLQEGSLSKDKLLEIREKEQSEHEAEWAARNATERMELEQLRIEMERHKVIAKLENFPMFLADRVRGTNAEEIEADARNLMNRILKDRSNANNARKVTPRPQSGSGKQIGRTADEVKHMTSKERMAWSATASEEEFAEVFDELHSE